MESKKAAKISHTVSNTTSTERKITKIGNSLGITLPANMLNSLNITLGEQVEIVVNNDSMIIRKSNKVKLPDNISKDFFNVLNETMREYDSTIKELRDH